MNIIELKDSIKGLIIKEYTLTVSFTSISTINGLKKYNRTILDSVENLPGVYIWENSDNNEIWYIGMAGRINQLGNIANHSVRDRLKASRYKDSETGRDVSTNKYILDLMTEENCNNLNIHVIHLYENSIPAYAEAVLLNTFFQRNRVLPKFNMSF